MLKAPENEATKHRAAAYNALAEAERAAERGDYPAAQDATNRAREELEKSRTWAAVAKAEEGR